MLVNNVAMPLYDPPLLYIAYLLHLSHLALQVTSSHSPQVSKRIQERSTGSLACRCRGRGRGGGGSLRWRGDTVGRSAGRRGARSRATGTGGGLEKS